MPPKRRRRFQGLYYHSSPPKVMPMNGLTSHQDGRKKRDIDDFSVKLSTIRIWMHEKDIGKLTRILWAGQGHRLSQQASTNPKVKRFLGAVPYVMNSIKDVHQSVIDNNLETLQAKLEPPVPAALITCKDANGLNVIHKAAGLGHTMMLEYLLGVWPDGAHECDITGKTPLHWAASAKNNMRCYTLLTQAGCDEEALDYKMNTPSYYRHKPHDLERAFLVYVPEAPRISPGILTDWEALNHEGVEGKKLSIKIPEINGNHSSARTLDESGDNTSDLIDGLSANDEDEMPKDHEEPAVENNNAVPTPPATPPVTPTKPEDVENEEEQEEPSKEEAEETEETQENEELVAPDEEGEEAELNTEAKANDDAEMDALSETKAATENLESDENNTKALNERENDKESELEEKEDEDEHGDENEEEYENNDSFEGERVEEDAEDNEKTKQKEDEEHIENGTKQMEEDTEESANQEDKYDKIEETEPEQELQDDNKSEHNNNEQEEEEDPDKNNLNTDISNTNLTEAEQEIQKDSLKNIENGDTEAEAERDADVEDVEEKESNEYRETSDTEELQINKSNELQEPVQSQDEVENENETDKTDKNVLNQNTSEINDNDKDDENENENENLSLKSKVVENGKGALKNKKLYQDQETGEATCVKETTNDKKEPNEEEFKYNENYEKKENKTLEVGYNEEDVQTGKPTDANDEELRHLDRRMPLPGSSSLKRSTTQTTTIDGAEADEDDDEDVVVPTTAPRHSSIGRKLTHQLETSESFDENHNEEKYTTTTTTTTTTADSPTSSLAIEGFVHGDSEDNTVQSQSAAFIDEEAHLQHIIASGDMEQLAQIVLNGDGRKLLNMESPEAEIQAFLNNVPNYMSKIRRVHEAARDGSLLSLQQALDRRKFAIAKDEISPNGTTPLHVGILFGHSDIVRYLAARFPETTDVTDNDGRTALHYAATIKDNGHYYNLLVQLGANPKVLDKLGHTPEFYLDREQSKEVLTYGQLLANFGAEELEERLLCDQVPDDLHSARRVMTDVDVSRTLDRCFSVIQESSKVLSGATASAIAQRKPTSGTALQLHVTSYLSRFLKRSIYEKIKKRQTRLDHNLFDIFWPAMRKTSKQRPLEEDINCGVIAPDFDVYVVFQEFLVPLLKDMHCIEQSAQFKPHPRIAYFPMENGERLNTAAFAFDDESSFILRCVVEASRNLEDFELPLNLSIGLLEQAERMMMGRIFTNTFAEAIGETDSGNYYTLTEIMEENSDIRPVLTSQGLMIPLLDMKDAVQEAESLSFNGSLWPYGRGVYVNSQHNLALWLNCQEHLRVISATTGKDATDIGAAYTRVGRAVCFLEGQLHFRESYLLGYLQSRPAYLGTGLKFATSLRLPNLMKEMDNLRHLCAVRGLKLIANPLTKTVVRLVNMQSLSTMEYVIFQDYCTAVNNILSLEKDMSLTNSKHIASMLVKIFRRKAVQDGDSYLTNPIFRTEQGKYLANTLADPLIKALTEIAHKRPEDPVTFLANFLQSYARMNNANAPSSSSKTSSTAIMNSNFNGKATYLDMEEDHISVNEDGEQGTTPQVEDRDEHGQSMLHFACARSHRRGGLTRLIEESNVYITYRDELYRTARDVSLQANQLANAKEIDRYVLSLAVVGDLRPFEQLALAGYDHILDVTDDGGQSIVDVVADRGHEELAEFLRNLRSLEEIREELHQMIRENRLGRVQEITATENGKWLLKAKNYYGRTALHIAVLKEAEEIVEYLVDLGGPELLKIGDNLERTALHYAMGTNAIESLSRILIQKGAKRTNKDLKGRQPSYYFMNKADVLRLQEEEDENR